MTETELFIPREHDSFSEITLNGELLLIRFTYNDTFDYWTFGIYDLNQTPIIVAVKIVPNFPLNLFLPMRRLGGTRFAATSKQQHIGRDDFWNEKTRFWVSWLRKYKLTAGKPGNPGFETDALRVASSVSRSEEKSGNSASLSIWNLNKNHRETVTDKDCYIELQAGYEDTELITIFTGYVTYGDTEPDGADRRTALELVDGRVPVRDTYCSRAYSGSTDSKKIIDDTARDMDLTVSYADDCEFGQFPNGFSFLGQGASALDKACAASELSWYIDNNTLHVKKIGGTKSKRVFELSAQSGLIGFPKKITKSGKSDEDKDVTGYEVQYFLNAAIDIGDYVYLNSTEVKGYFRVQSLKIDGDTRPGDWACTATLMYTD